LATAGSGLRLRNAIGIKAPWLSLFREPSCVNQIVGVSVISVRYLSSFAAQTSSSTRPAGAVVCVRDHS
jgi:hypothetical protein